MEVTCYVRKTTGHQTWLLAGYCNHCPMSLHVMETSGVNRIGSQVLKCLTVAQNAWPCPQAPSIMFMPHRKVRRSLGMRL